MKEILETLSQKGFLWCVMNSGKIDMQVQSSEGKIQDAFNLFEVNLIERPQFIGHLSRELLFFRFPLIST